MTEISQEFMDKFNALLNLKKGDKIEFAWPDGSKPNNLAEVLEVPQDETFIIALYNPSGCKLVTKSGMKLDFPHDCLQWSILKIKINNIKKVIVE